MYVVQLLAGLACLFAALWAVGAFYYDAGKQTWRGVLLAIVWSGFMVLVFALLKPWLALIVFAISFSCILLWWVGQKPSHDRNWDECFSELPRLQIAGDVLTVDNVRNTTYRSLDDYDCRFENRTYRMSELQAADVLILYWGSTLMCHPMVIFDFGNGKHLCFSIEVRYRENDRYGVFKGIYRQNELMYVVCDERDAILRRTKYANGQECYLYRLQTGRDHAKQLFYEYMETTNGIYDQPKWYNTLTSNCTTSIYFQRKGQIPWDWRMLFNGTFDKMLYDWERLYQDLPFDELRKKSLINEVANAASEEDFGPEIRAKLPGF